VAPGQYVSFDAEPVPRKRLLPGDRKEAVVGTGHGMDRNGRPGAEVAHRLEHRVSFRALILFPRRGDLQRDIVEEVGEQIELRSVTALLCRGDPRLR
jgi:hypothetical protein